MMTRIIKVHKYNKLALVITSEVNEHS